MPGTIIGTDATSSAMQTPSGAFEMRPSSIASALFQPPGRRLSKRITDLVLLVLSTPVLIPLSALVALAVRLEKRGPVFFSQERVGYNGKSFRMWKFRSMVSDAEEVLGAYLDSNDSARAEWEANQKLRDDPRVTPLGHFLRRSSLDEIPQLWNVWRGEMSLVGPRPIVRDETVRYGDRFHFYVQTRPGLTGLWQVSGRSDTTYGQRVELDTRYVREWSLIRDLGIVMKTFQVLLRRGGAY
jgi:Undecaprenyl-phosphate galactose phosphotransferase WbaP